MWRLRKQRRRLLQRFVYGYFLLQLCSVWTMGTFTYAEPSVYTNAQAAALIDVESGRMLYSLNGDKEMLIASLTKIMTAIVAIEHADPNETVTITSRSAGVEGSSIYLKVGEKMKLRDLLYGLMLRSGNDAATAIAEHVGGSVEGFVYMMNDTAQMVGLKHTQFKNPSGLDEPGHFSTANDLATLTAYAMKNDNFKQIVKAPQMRSEQRDYAWRNKNKMISIYDGADGVKTGYTKKAQRCLVSSATRHGQQLVAVTLRDHTDWEDHRKMLDYGFSNYPLTQLATQGTPIADQNKIVIGRTVNVALTKQEQTQLDMNINLISKDAVQYQLGERGLVEWYLAGKRVALAPLYSQERAKWFANSFTDAISTTLQVFLGIDEEGTQW